MKITRVYNLIAQYGQKILDGDMSQEEVNHLSRPDIFAYSSDEDCSNSDAMRLFVLYMAPKIPSSTLIALIDDMINKAPPPSFENNFIQQDSLIKFFLAYVSVNSHNQLAITLLVEDICTKQQVLHEAVDATLTLASQFFRKTYPLGFYSMLMEGSEIPLNLPTLLNEQNRPTSPIKKLTLGDSAKKKLNSDNSAFIAELQAFKDHYSSTSTQAHESIFNSKKKGQSKAKANIAMELIKILETSDCNDIANNFSQLLAENNLDCETFFSGKSKEYLSPNLTTTLQKNNRLSTIWQKSNM